MNGTIDRRSLLRASAGVAVVGLAGCSGDGDGESPADDGVSATDGQTTRSPTATLSSGGADRSPGSLSTDSERARLAASDGDGNDRFGSAVAVSDDAVLVGAPQDEDPNGYTAGSAYVFERAGGQWTQTAKLVADDGQERDNFGVAVALAGDTALIGARGDENPPGEGTGAAYVFERTGGEWTQAARLDAADGIDRFGTTVALDGDTALVSAAGDTTGDTTGVVYVYERAGGSWGRTATLGPWDGDTTDVVQHAVALAGDTALIGANRSAIRPEGSAGAAYVYERAGGSWRRTATLGPEEGPGAATFGRTVALAGDSALVGAPGTSDPNGERSGAVYAFERTGGDWSRRRKLTAVDGDASDGFGWAVSSDGSRAVVGATGDAGPDGRRAGTAYALRRSDGEWTQTAKLVASDGQRGYSVGWAVAVADGTAVTGANSAQNADGDVAVGAAYLYDL